MRIPNQSFALAVAALGGLAALGVSGSARAAIVLDGSLDAAYGSPLVVQTMTSNAELGSNGLPLHTTNGDTPSHDQLSNAYGVIDVANNHLNLFFGGAVKLNDDRLILLTDANPNTGVASLALGAHAGVNDVGIVPSFDSSANLKSAIFDSGFRPEYMFQFQFGGGNVIFNDNLTAGTESKDDFGTDPRGRTSGSNFITRGAGSGTDPAGAPVISISDDTSNEGTLITSGFGSVNKGFEVQFNLTDLGWVPGSPINVSAFIDEQSNNGISNQILSPTGSYTDASNYFNFNFGNNTLWPDVSPAVGQFFTIPVPEPMSLGLIGLIAIPALARRNHKSA